jgi:hypothetical protein
MSYATCILLFSQSQFCIVSRFLLCETLVHLHFTGQVFAMPSLRCSGAPTGCRLKCATLAFELRMQPAFLCRYCAFAALVLSQVHRVTLHRIVPFAIGYFEVIISLEV